MSLVADYGNSSASSSSSESNSDSESETISRTKDIIRDPSDKPKLPAPVFGYSKTDFDDVQASVFKNPFREAENAKEAALQKHVKMVETKDNIVIINGKKICWNYRKGRCRFGHNCKFAHDSDIQKTNDQIEAEKQVAVRNSVVCQGNQSGHAQYSPQNAQQETEETNEEKDRKQKRKRPGLTQGLVPGKKVMKNYMKHQKI